MRTITKLFSTLLVSVGFSLPIFGIQNKATANYCEPVPHAAEDLQALNIFWGTQIPICRLPPGTNNAYADRQSNIVLADQDWLDYMAFNYGNWAATGILAHEWGHMVQGEVSGTAAELQSDCLAGVFLRGMGLPWGTVEQFASANFDAGDDYWTIHGHGTRIQRVNAARRGYYGYSGQTGIYLTQLCPFSAF